MKQENEKKDEKKISILINSIFYFVECGFILSSASSSDFRLIVLHRGRVLTDACYETVRGAKIAFSRVYGSNVWKEGIKPQWSHFYCPDTRWLDTLTHNLIIEEVAIPLSNNS